MDRPIRQESLTNQVMGILTERIERGVYAPNTQLPAESVLVEELDVSRATIRRAFDILEANGKVIRRLGIGTFVSSATKIINPINEPVLFQELIEKSGYKPGVIYLDSKICIPRPEVGQALKIGETDEVLELSKVFTADGENVIYLVNSIPLWVLNDEIKQEILSQPEITEPVFDFFEQRCKQKLVYYICILKSDLMANCSCKGEKINENESALVFDEIGLNQEDIPILHSIHYYPGDKMKFELVRRRIF